MPDRRAGIVAEVALANGQERLLAEHRAEEPRPRRDRIDLAALALVAELVLEQSICDLLLRLPHRAADHDAVVDMRVGILAGGDFVEPQRRDDRCEREHRERQQHERRARQDRSRLAPPHVGDTQRERRRRDAHTADIGLVDAADAAIELLELFLELAGDDEDHEDAQREHDEGDQDDERVAEQLERRVHEPEDHEYRDEYQRRTPGSASTGPGMRRTASRMKNANGRIRKR